MSQVQSVKSLFYLYFHHKLYKRQQLPVDYLHNYQVLNHFSLQRLSIHLVS